MSVLSNLFSDIALAIRQKTGEIGTMKPAQFPGKISGIIVGTDSLEVDGLLDQINGEIIGEVAVASGTCGTGVNYLLTDGGLLKITGSGAITSHPWSAYEDDIVKVVMSDGITSIPQQAFSSCNNLTSVTLSKNLTEIGTGSFSSCTSLTGITIPASVQTIGYIAFSNCPSLTRVKFEDTAGWKVYKSTGGLTLAPSSSELSDQTTAAELLRTYTDKWQNS